MPHLLLLNKCLKGRISLDSKVINELIQSAYDGWDIKDRVYNIRGQFVMLDCDLAEIYGYEVKNLNQQVKRNIGRFPEDFMFQLTREEIDFVKSQFVISQRNNFFEGQSGGRRTLPYAFTEQGIYMLATVLKGELAEQQSIFIMRAFREMRYYLMNNKQQISIEDFLKLSLQVNENIKDVQKIKQEIVTKDYLNEVMNEFIGTNIQDEYLFLDGEKFSATFAYEQIYSAAKSSIYVVDNYIGPKTLIHLKGLNNKINIIIFSDNVGHGLNQLELNDFKVQYPNVNLSFQTTNSKYHDRYIILDYGTSDEVIYHCGASSKDAGNRIMSITKVNDVTNYSSMIVDLLSNPILTL